MQPSGAFAGGSNRKMDVFSPNHSGPTMTMPPRNEVHVREEIALEPELLNSLYRRGGRRLRDIQKSCRVSVWFDKFRGVLQLSGSQACVAAAKNLIAGLGGPRLPVSAAVWSELSRTRKLLSGPEAAVANIQLESGCRIHVERTRYEVHLFGDAGSVAIAEKLLSELDQKCIEEVMKLSELELAVPDLQAIANQCGVTLRFEEEEDMVQILGIRDSVKKTLDTISQSPKDASHRLRSELFPVAPIESAETKTGAKSAGATNSASNVQSGSNDSVRTVCPTCKACPFCPSCGHPTTFVDSAEPSGFALPMPGSNGQAVPYMNGMWRQMPFMPAEGCNGQIAVMNGVPSGGAMENMVPMAFMMPGSQNMQVCFVPAQMMAG